MEDQEAVSPDVSGLRLKKYYTMAEDDVYMHRSADAQRTVSMCVCACVCVYVWVCVCMCGCVCVSVCERCGCVCVLWVSGYVCERACGYICERCLCVGVFEGEECGGGFGMRNFH